MNNAPLNDLYNHYISKSERDKAIYEDLLKINTEKEKTQFALLAEEKVIIKNKLGVELDDFKEYLFREYQSDEKLFKTCVRLTKLLTDENLLKYIKDLIIYCDAIKNVYVAKSSIVLCNNRSKISFQDYKDIVKDYYCKCNDLLIEGKGIELSHDLGTIVLNAHDGGKEGYKLNPIDYQATAKKKAEIIAKGLKPYNPEEAEEYKKAGIPYDGIDCIVRKETAVRIFCELLGSGAFPGSYLKFMPANTVPKDLRGQSYKELAKTTTDKKLSFRKYYLIGRAQIEVYRNDVNILRYKHEIEYE